MNYAIEILQARYYVLKEQLIKAQEEMGVNPNQYSDNVIRNIQPKMDDIKEVFSKLGYNL